MGASSCRLTIGSLSINVYNLAPGMVLTPFNQAAIDDPDLLEEQVQSIRFRPTWPGRLWLDPPVFPTTVPGPSADQGDG